MNKKEDYNWQFSKKVLNSVLFSRNRLYSHLRRYPTVSAVQCYKEMLQIQVSEKKTKYNRLYKSEWN